MKFLIGIVKLFSLFFYQQDRFDFSKFCQFQALTHDPEELCNTASSQQAIFWVTGSGQHEIGISAKFSFSFAKLCLWSFSIITFLTCCLIYFDLNLNTSIWKHFSCFHLLLLVQSKKISQMWNWTFMKCCTFCFLNAQVVVLWQ